MTRSSEEHGGDQNSNEDRIIVRDIDAKYGVIEESLITDLRLGDAAARVAAYLRIKPNGWEISRVDIVKRLGLKKEKWQSARRQLISAGYFECKKTRLANGRFTHALYFNPFAWKSAPDRAMPKPEAKLAFPPSSRISDHKKPEPGFPAPAKPAPVEPAPANPAVLPTPVLETPALTTPPQPHARTGGGGGAVLIECLVGSGLPGLEDQVFAARLAEEASGATEEMARWAAAAIRSAIRAGTARDPQGFAIGMARKAAAGTVTAPTAAPISAASSASAERAKREGCTARLPDGRTITVERGSGGALWRLSTGGIVAGEKAAALWARVESGELKLLAALV